MLYSNEGYFILPAFPIDHVVDPTGAGDTFAAGFFGYLARLDQDFSIEAVKQACVHGCLLASLPSKALGWTLYGNWTGRL